MKIVNENNTTHEFKLVPRFYPTSTMTLTLKNESTQVEEEIPIDTIDIALTNNYFVLDGYLNLKFNYTFQDKDRFQFKLEEGKEIVFRGKIYATSEETQDYKQTNGVYTYEF